MKTLPITIGRIVLYTLTFEDVDEICLSLPPMKSGFETPAFCSGEIFPMMVTKKETDGGIEGMVFLGAMILRKQGIYGYKDGLKGGCWTWPGDVPTKESALLEGVMEQEYQFVKDQADKANLVKVSFWKPAVPVDQLARFTDGVARILNGWSTTTKPKSGVITLKQSDGSKLVFTQE